MYELGSNLWVEVEKKGKSTVIKDSEKPKLKQFYEKALAARGNGVKPNQSVPAGSSGQASNTKPSQQTSQSEKPNNVEESKLPDGTYKIIEIKPGNKSAFIKLANYQGEVVETYAKNEIQSIGVGGLIRKIDLQRKKNDFQEFNVLNSYEAA